MNKQNANFAQNLQEIPAGTPGSPVFIVSTIPAAYKCAGKLTLKSLSEIILHVQCTSFDLLPKSGPNKVPDLGARCLRVIITRLKGLVNRLEDCARAFLRSINLGPALGDTSTGRYISRLHQLDLEPLVLRRIKASLILAFKLIFGLVPVSNLFFSPLCLEAAGSSVSGGTRGAGALRAHPYPLRLTGPTDDGWNIGLSERSFAFLIARIWNDLPLDVATYESLPSFSNSLDKLNFSRVKSVKEFMGTYSDFFSTDSLPSSVDLVR